MDDSEEKIPLRMYETLYCELLGQDGQHLGYVTVHFNKYYPRDGDNEFLFISQNDTVTKQYLQKIESGLFLRILKNLGFIRSSICGDKDLSVQV